MPFSQIIPPSPSLTESKRLFYTSVSLLLSHIQVYHYHLSKFHIYALVCVCEVTQSCPTLCDPMDCSLLGSSLHGILQARVLEWVAISFSRGSSRPMDRTQVSRIAGRRFNL